jgi:hypothetical protein
VCRSRGAARRHLDDRDPRACGFVTKSTRDVSDGTTVSGPPTWACICMCEWGVEERGTKPRPLLDVDMDAERELDEVDVWRSMVFVIFVVEVNWETSIDVDHFTVIFISTGVGREGLECTLPWLVLCAPFVPRVSVGLRPRHMCRLVIKSWNTQSSKP